MSSAEVPECIGEEEYLAKEDISPQKNEYIGGWVRAMAGASLRHNRVRMNAAFNLMKQLGSGPCIVLDADMKLRLKRGSDTRFYYPDLQVVCEPISETAVTTERPALIIEVLSPSTRQYDLDEKLHAYLQISSLQAYILLEQHQPLAIVLRRTEGGFLREVVEGLTESIQLPFLNCVLPMNELYSGIEFTPTCVQEPGTEFEIGSPS